VVLARLGVAHVAGELLNSLRVREVVFEVVVHCLETLGHLDGVLAVHAVEIQLEPIVLDVLDIKAFVREVGPRRYLGEILLRPHPVRTKGLMGHLCGVRGPVGCSFHPAVNASIEEVFSPGVSSPRGQLGFGILRLKIRRKRLLHSMGGR